jgi:hypothetical protein
VALLITLCCGVGLGSLVLLFLVIDWMDIPSPEMLRDPTNPSRAFLVEAKDLRGIYGNHDVDCAVYEYFSAFPEDRFWMSVDTQAQNAGWLRIRDLDDVRRYQRICAATGQQLLHSAEEVRVSFNRTTQRVVVAWAQADLSRARKSPESFPEDTGEGRFVRRVVWPKFDESIK